MTRISSLAMALAITLLVSAVMAAVVSAAPRQTLEVQRASNMQPVRPEQNRVIVEIAQLKRALARTQAKIARVTNQINRVKDEIQQLTNEIDTLEVDIAIVKGQIKADQDQITATIAEIARLKREIDKLKNEIRENERQAAEAMLLIAHLQTKSAQLSARIVTVRQARNASIARKQICVAIAEANEEFSQAARCAAGIVRQQNRLQREENSLNAKIAARASRISAAQAKISQLNTDRGSKQSLRGLRELDLSIAQQILPILRGDLATRRLALDALMLALARKETERHHLGIVLAKLQAKLARLEATLATLEEEIVEVEAPKPTGLTTSLSGGSKSGARITVPEGTGVSDKAKLSGAFAAQATGTIEYDVYSDSACTKLVKAAGTVAVSGKTVPRSNSEMLVAGTYYWRASFGGDKTNLPATSVCGAELETVSP